MKTFSKALMISSVAAIGLAVAGLQSAVADEEHGDCRHRAGHARLMGHGEDGYVERLADRLELSAAQRTQVQTVLDQARPAMRAIRDKLHANREALRKLGAADPQQLQGLADEHGRLVAEMIVQRARMRGAIDPILTPDQRQQLEQMHDRFEHHRRS